VQRGAVPPLIEMLGAQDIAIKEMAAFALGRLAQNSHNQVGMAGGRGVAGRRVCTTRLWESAAECQRGQARL
jgi:HEAT repeat protein